MVTKNRMESKKISSGLIPFLFFFFMLVPFLFSYGQGNVSEQVEVKRDYKPILSTTEKIKSTPVLFQESSKNTKLNYSDKDLSIRGDSTLNSISPEPVGKIDTNRILPFYIRGGGGNFQSILGELYYNNRPNPLGSFGINIRHFSQNGNLQNQNISKSELNFWGKKIFPLNYLSGHFGIDLNSDPFFGYNHTLNSFSSNQVKQDLRTIKAEMEFGPQIENSDSLQGVDYHAGFKGYYLGDSYSDQENHYEFDGLLGFKKNAFTFSLGGNYRYNLLKTPFQSFNTSLLKISPSITLQNDLFNLKLGLKLVYELGDRNQTYLFPDFSLDILLSNGFNVYGGLYGDILQNSFQNLLEKNTYLLPGQSIGLNGQTFNTNFDLQNTKLTLSLYFGIKGDISPSFNYKAQVDINQYDRLPFFIDVVNNFSTIDNFGLSYDGNKTVYTKLYGELNYLWNNQFRFNANLAINQYILNSLTNPFYQPDYKGEFIIHYNPNQDWLITSTLLAVGKQYAEINSLPTGNVNPVVQTINPYLDLNLGLEYKLSKKVGVFVRANNLFNKEYLQFINYPVVGLNIIGGLSLRF